ncbi:MAG: serine/threonine protein kinase [Myxococcaceae bacterium]
MSFGSYVLGSRIAQGGMGEIYTAIRVGIGNFRKPVAIKLLLSHLADEEHIVQMFLGEAFIAARMNHPNIVQVYDVGHEAGRYFMSMELVRGIAMWSFIGAMARKGQRLPASLICYIGRELCEGLHYAHELCDEQGRPLNVIHRDVTPANILLTEEGRAKVTDFGIAKARDVVTKTYPGTVKGTLEYLSPEQASGARVDRRADIYCAGVTLFHLATYQSPFWKGNDLATIEAIQNEPLPSLTRMRPDLPSALATALSKATHKDPNGRYPTAKEFRDAIPPGPPHEVCADELAKLVREVLGPDRPVAPHVAATAAPARGSAGEKTVQMDKRALPADRPSLASDGDRITALVSAKGLESGETSVPVRVKTRRTRWATAAIVVMVVLATAGIAAYTFGLPKQLLSLLRRFEPDLVASKAVVQEEEVPATAGKTSLRTDDLPPPVAAVKPVEPEEVVKAPDESGEVAEDERKRAAEERRAELKEERARERRERDKDDDDRKGRMGYLNVRSARTAQVLVNGRRVGETPLTRYPVAPGDVTVILKTSSGKTEKHVLRVSAGKQLDLRADFKDR